MRVLYFASLALVVVLLVINVTSLTGRDLIVVLFGLWPILMLLAGALVFTGFGYETRGWLNFCASPRRRWHFSLVLRGLPTFGRFIIYATYAYSVICFAALGIYYSRYGSVRAGVYYPRATASRAATAFEEQREESWVVYALSGFGIAGFAAPALHCLFGNREE